eukprot:scaffold4173_cov54-Phaeocystis_antarctica.AAC.3
MTGAHPGVLGVRGRPDFSRFDPRPERPHFSNFGPPAGRRPFCENSPQGQNLVPICSRSTLADLTPKYPTLVASTPGCRRATSVKQPQNGLAWAGLAWAARLAVARAARPEAAFPAEALRLARAARPEAAMQASG